MTAPGDPRRAGRHASPSEDAGADHSFPRHDAPGWEQTGPTWYSENSSSRFEGSDRATGGIRRVSGLLDRFPEQTGPIVEPEWWADGSSDGRPLAARHGEDRRTEPGGSGRHSEDWSGPSHPSGPLPPRPAGVWDRLRPREDTADDDAQTVAQRFVPPAGDPRPGHEAADRHPEDGDPHHHHLAADDDADDTGSWDRTGGLEVIGAHVQEPPRRRWGRRDRRSADTAGPADELQPGEVDPTVEVPVVGNGRPYAELDDPRHYTDDDVPDGDEPDGDVPEDDIPIAPYDHRGERRRRRRRPFAVVMALVVLGAIVVGIVLGGQRLIGMLGSRDYTGQGTGSIDIRVKDGDTLSDIGRTLVEADVIASVGPFAKAADRHPQATSIQPGVYRMRAQMSGRAALERMLDPAARLLARVTVPEGLTVQATLQRLADKTGVPLDQLQAAAANPAALGLPPYAGGVLEGFLFPATYDFEPGTTPVDMLKDMVAHTQKTLDSLQIPVDQRLRVVTEASIVQAEASSTADMAKVAKVLDNRLAAGMPLQLDTTVNYATGKTGLTTTAEDRTNQSPYNTYVHPGLPPGAISNPGEDALRAVLSPTPGDWLFFVVVNPETGDTRFAVTAAEHQRNVALFQQWLREHPGG